MKALLIILLVIVILFVLLFTIYMFNLDMKFMTYVVAPILEKHYDKIDRNQYL
ncbi:MAG: hypothetical protein HUJ71_05840 [Pseudobutyrivibrio sp.]|nr:hypothetical protein [Pseudobutyrivibrio sp.]